MIKKWLPQETPWRNDAGEVKRRRRVGRRKKKHPFAVLKENGERL